MDETPVVYNTKIIEEMRASQGHAGGQWEHIPLLLLHHTGAKSGVRRVNPVAYLRDGTRYLIWAANGGAPKNPDWYYNLKAFPMTKIEVSGETTHVIAEEAAGPERDRLFALATQHYPQLLEAARKTERAIPFMILAPSALTANG